jgi:hypothetical protein
MYPATGYEVLVVKIKYGSGRYRKTTRSAERNGMI